MMKQDKSLKYTTLACSCDSGSVNCVHVTENKYTKIGSKIAVYAFYHTCKKLRISTLHICLKSRKITKNFRQDSGSRNTE